MVVGIDNYNTQISCHPYSSFESDCAKLGLLWANLDTKITFDESNFKSITLNDIWSSRVLVFNIYDF